MANHPCAAFFRAVIVGKCNLTIFPRIVCAGQVSCFEFTQNFAHADVGDPWRNGPFYLVSYFPSLFWWTDPQFSFFVLREMMCSDCFLCCNGGLRSNLLLRTCMCNCQIIPLPTSTPFPPQHLPKPLPTSGNRAQQPA